MRRARGRNIASLSRDPTREGFAANVEKGISPRVGATPSFVRDYHVELLRFVKLMETNWGMRTSHPQKNARRRRLNIFCPKADQ